MKKESESDNMSSDDIELKLDRIIEQSRTERDALKKLLVGLEKLSTEETEQFQKKQKQNKKSSSF